MVRHFAFAVASLLASSAFAADKYLQVDRLDGGTANGSVTLGTYQGAGVLFTPDAGGVTVRAIDILVLPRGSSSSGQGAYLLNVWDEVDGGQIAPPSNIRGNRVDEQPLLLTASTTQFNRWVFANPIVVPSGRVFV